jgi:alpha-tubulin suppressor-like RCC1 family protein
MYSPSQSLVNACAHCDATTRCGVGARMAVANSAMARRPNARHRLLCRDSSTVELWAGPRTTCAADRDQVIRCWGAAFTYGDHSAGREPTRVPGVDHVEDLVAGWDTSCARTSGGEIRCWGNHADRRLRGSSDSVVTLVDHAGDVTRMTLGLEHGCLLRAAGTVSCWGANDRGQLGVGDMLPRDGLVPVAGLADVADLSVMDETTCALVHDGTVRCWSSDIVQPLPGGSPHLLPITLPRVHGGRPFATALGAVYILGNHGSLDSRSALEDASVQFVAGDPTSIVQVALGDDFGCARFRDGALECWGANREGQRGTGRFGVIASPETQRRNHTSRRMFEATQVPGIVATDVAAGSEHVCSVTTDGLVLCWGRNESGQLGYSAPQDCWERTIDTAANRISCSATPRPVTGLRGVVQVALGNRHSCARLRDGTVRCWGADDVGQLDANPESFWVRPRVVEWAAASSR